MQKTRKCGMNVFNILVVEDNIELQELYCISLYNNGYNALHAKDGIEALDILEHHFIDLVISDIMMPNMDGFQLVKELKDINSTIPVLITKQQLFDEIWGFDSETDIHTIDVHIARIREKFRDNTDFSIVTIRGLGYKVMANETK